MLNKKGVAVGLSPLKFLLAIFIIIPLLIILFVAFGLMMDSHAEKTDVLVSSALAKDKWFEILNKDVDGRTVAELLETHYSSIKLGSKEDAVFEKKLDAVCKKAVEEIIPDNIKIIQSEAGRIEGEDEYICEIKLGSDDLKVKFVSKMLKCSGFQDLPDAFGPFGTDKAILYLEEKVPNQPYFFKFYFHNADSLTILE